MNDPRPLELGQPISLDSLTRLGGEVVARTPGRGLGGLVQQHGTGTLTLPMPRGLQPGERRGSGAASHPFRVTDASYDDEGTPTAAVRVRFGQVNSVTPLMGLDDEPLDADPAPILMVDSGVVYLKVVLDEEDEYSVAEVYVMTGATLPESTATEAYLTIATVTVVAADGGGTRVGAINQSVTHSLQHLLCGGSKHLFCAI